MTIPNPYTFLSPRTTHSITDEIVGIMGMDFKISRIKDILEESYPECATNSFTLDHFKYIFFLLFLIHYIFD